MRSPGLSRPRTRLFAAATLALAALSLTACGPDNGSGVRSEGSAAANATASATAASPGPAPEPNASNSSGSASGSSSGSHSGSSTGGGSTASSSKRHPAASDPYDPAHRVPCTAANTKVTATLAPRPLNHLLLTVTNTGSTMCDLKDYPIVQFEGAQSVPPVLEDSKPQAATSLKPGAQGYAGVILSAGDGSGGEGYTARHLKVGFQDSDKMADAALQAGGVHIDNALRVTYWLTRAADALQ
ncbi:DUF4232 domain-containing protein [Streptomyces sp. WZ-12]|uniref:DUF4232 domain-containing protein n=1 Tax=Streptomyces sp. WZ-12 TaxID=3030210 RepID=UPI00238173D1|nr:DUF4232 domain-containing protein [Streptomyces sp. WZ-12]